MRFTRTATQASIALLMIVLLATVAAAQSHAHRGYLFIVGGGPQPDSLVKRFVDLAGGQEGEDRRLRDGELGWQGERRGESRRSS